VCDLIKIKEKGKRIRERKLVCCDADIETVPFVFPTTLTEKEMVLDWGEFTKFPPMPPHVHYGLSGLSCWLWPKCNRLLRLRRP
jgi:hypothetical protein